LLVQGVVAQATLVVVVLVVCFQELPLCHKAQHTQ
jgi:hypothetical protein